MIGLHSSRVLQNTLFVFFFLSLSLFLSRFFTKLKWDFQNYFRIIIKIKHPRFECEAVDGTDWNFFFFFFFFLSDWNVFVSCQHRVATIRHQINKSFSLFTKKKNLRKILKVSNATSDFSTIQKWNNTENSIYVRWIRCLVAVFLNIIFYFIIFFFAFWCEESITQMNTKRKYIYV